MTYSRKQAKVEALLYKLGEEEARAEDDFDPSSDRDYALEWVFLRLFDGWKWKHFRDLLNLHLLREYGWDLRKPEERIRQWIYADPERKRLLKEARQIIRESEAEEAVREADESVMAHLPVDEARAEAKKMTNSEVYLLKERRRHLMDKAERLAPQDWSPRVQAAEVKAEADTSIAEQHFKALKEWGNFAALKAAQAENQPEPAHLPAPQDEDPIEEADYELLEEAG